MECTQRLECTQDLYETHTERVCPEQIGFLGICGAKHPVLRGPNKIGRDPQTCSIVLNLNSVSKQHAVINVLSSKEYMLMDLDSTNKTKLLNKTLQPYIPHPIRNGDTVQFGDIFGIFRLLEEDDELPMTQAIDIPETPVQSKHISKLTKTITTVIPESPDVSDRDDSFVTPSQPISDTTRLSSGQFIKPFGKSISIHPVSSPKKDTSQNSSKRTISFNENPNTSLNESMISLKVDKIAENIHEMNTQAPYPIANPSVDESNNSIYMADTQIPPALGVSPSIHSLDTQIPATEHLPHVRKINDQQEMQFDIYAANKENDLSIYNAETQPFIFEKDESTNNKNKVSSTLKKPEDSPKSGKDLNKSEDELLFDEIVDDCFEDFNSQPLLPQESPKHELNCPKELKTKNTIIESDGSTDCEDIDIAPTQKVEELPKIEQSTKIVENLKPEASKRTNRVKSDSSTDCEDIEIMPTQIIPELPKANDKSKDLVNNKEKTNAAKRTDRIKSDSSTDCEDIDTIPTLKIPEKKLNLDDDLTDCEDDIPEISVNKATESKSVRVTKFEDMPTQVIDLDPDKVGKVAFEDMNTQIICIDDNAAAKPKDDDSFEDQPTQIIDEIKLSAVAEKPFDDIISPFKIPLQSPIRVKSREIPKIVSKDKIPEVISIDDDNYYNATQDILDDLCTQREGSPILSPSKQTAKSKVKKSPIITDDEVVPCSVEGYKVGEKFANIDREISPTKHHAGVVQDVRDVITIEASVSKPKKMPSDSSDIECTPKKVRSYLFTDSDLPNSQEIKTNVHINYSKAHASETSSESEPEVNTEDQNTPFLHRKKKPTPVAKIDLTKKFDAEKLPERIITRVRKPTSKMQGNLQMNKKTSANMLKPKFITEQEDQIDQDIITENVKRLKNYEKAKSSKDAKNDSKSKDAKNDTKIKEDKSKNEIQESKNDITKEVKNIKSKEPSEQFKVKIEKPKKKDADKESKSKGKEDLSARKLEESTRKDRGKSPVAKNKENTSRKSTNDNNQSKEDTRRSTRSRRKCNDTKRVGTKSVSPENNKKEPVENKRKRPTRKRDEPKESFSPEIEIRRSKRQAKPKENKSDSQTMQGPKSILKKITHEQSTVYNVSSSSGESPKNLKRSLADDSEVPSPKRTRAFVNNVNNSITNSSLRATPARTMKTQHVLFTAFPSEEVKQKLEKLGAVIVTDVTECSVVLTMQVKRTFKLLCAVGLGRPIVGPSWVQACVDTNMIVDPWLYLVKDEAAEKRFQFSLEKTLNGKRNFLKGYNVSSTPSVQPNALEMKLIVECSGGTWKEGGSNWVCVSSTKDQALWPALRKRGATIVSTEFILGGVLRQKLEITKNKFP